jgi:hypothetical protein
VHTAPSPFAALLLRALGGRPRQRERPAHSSDVIAKRMWSSQRPAMQR